MSEFEQVPKDFLEGITLELHTFADPENPLHGQLLHAQLRHELFFSTYGKAPNSFILFRLPESMSASLVPFGQTDH